MNQLKEKKKGNISQIKQQEFSSEVRSPVLIPGLMTVEDFFNRSGFETDGDIWKMNSSQLEATAAKQEKYIKHLKKLYKKVIS